MLPGAGPSIMAFCEPAGPASGAVCDQERRTNDCRARCQELRRSRSCGGRCRDELQLVGGCAFADRRHTAHSDAGRRPRLVHRQQLDGGERVAGDGREVISPGRWHPVSTASVVFGGFSLEDHWNQGIAQRRIAEGGWSIVVLQQGPSSLPESQVALRSGRAASIRSRAAGARQHSTWCGRSRIAATHSMR